MTGCSKVSPGCAHCYAERWRGIAGHPYEQGFDLRLWPHRLLQPLRWTRPRMMFVNSMSDLFHEDIPASFIADVWDVMVRAEQHTFQVLTKRHERLVDLAAELPWPDNVWMGVTIENRRFVHRADYLRCVPASTLRAATQRPAVESQSSRAVLRNRRPRRRCPLVSQLPSPLTSQDPNARAFAPFAGRPDQRGMRDAHESDRTPVVGPPRARAGG